jgi:DNA-directed RNA polymerase specialized sigma24 family protein/ribosome-associated translation inhibitor RaiA
MEYIVHNEKIIENKKHRNEIRGVINKQVQRINRITDNYHKPLCAEIYLNKISDGQYMVSCTVGLKEGVVFVKENGEDLTAMVYKLFDRLKLVLSKRIHKEKKDYLYTKKKTYFSNFNEYLPELRELKAANVQKLYNSLLKKVIGDLAKYIRRRIKMAEYTTAIKSRKIKVQEIIDELYLIIFDRFDQLPKDKAQTNLWLYKITDEILDKKFKELDFENKHFDDISKFVESEYDSLVEKYSVDGDEEIVPVEELDDYYFQSEYYDISDLYENNEVSEFDALTKQYSNKELHRIIEKELAKLPLLKRNVMDLYLIGQFTIPEIAQIKNISEIEIEAIIRETNKDLKKKLSFLV